MTEDNKMRSQHGDALPQASDSGMMKFTFNAHPYTTPFLRRLGRASYKATLLREQVLAFLKKNRPGFDIQYSEDRKVCEIRVRSFEVDSFFVNCSLEVSDIFHNLRSVLDNLSFALARLVKDPPENAKNIYFPMMEDRGKFQRRRPELEAIYGSNVVDVMEACQLFCCAPSRDCAGVEVNYLSLLVEVNNEDKHRTPSVAICNATGGINDFSTLQDLVNEEGREIEIFAPTLGRIKTGMLLSRVSSNMPFPSVDWDYELNYAVSLVVGSGRYELADAIVLSTQEVFKVVEKFDHFFQQNASL